MSLNSFSFSLTNSLHPKEGYRCLISKRSFLKVHAAVLFSVKCPRSYGSVKRSRKNTSLQEGVLPAL